MGKADKIRQISKAIEPPKINNHEYFKNWSDEDLRSLATIQEKTGCDPNKLHDEDKQELERLSAKYYEQKK